MPSEGRNLKPYSQLDLPKYQFVESNADSGYRLHKGDYEYFRMHFKTSIIIVKSGNFIANFIEIKIWRQRTKIINVM